MFVVLLLCPFVCTHARMSVCVDGFGVNLVLDVSVECIGEVANNFGPCRPWVVALGLFVYPVRCVVAGVGLLATVSLQTSFYNTTHLWARPPCLLRINTGRGVITPSRVISRDE
jgi:hypothetical protein